MPAAQSAFDRHSGGAAVHCWVCGLQTEPARQSRSVMQEFSPSQRLVSGLQVNPTPHCASEVHSTQRPNSSHTRPKPQTTSSVSGVQALTQRSVA